MSGIGWGRAAATVWRKEIVDALRDRRTLLVVLLSSVLMGPLVLVALSGLVASLEARAEQRELFVDGVEYAPTLVNFLQRQGFAVQAAPRDYEQQLRDSRFGDPVLVVGKDFEAALRRGETADVELVGDSANKRSEAGHARALRLVAAFNRERGLLALALRGVAPELLEPVRIDERDLANTQARGTQITGILPFFVLMAVLYGAMNAALDSTAGERERGSLEPLLMIPVPRSALVVGKWGAVFCVAMLIAVLSCASFVPAQALLRSDTLAALFQFGVREAVLFVLVLLPFAAAVSAVLMALAILGRSVKEAQALAGVLVLAVALLPLVGMLNLGAEAAWHAWVPALAQSNLMNRVLRGEAGGPAQMAVPIAVSAVLTVLALSAVRRTLARVAVK